MAKQFTPQEFFTLEKIIAGGVVLAVVLLVALQITHPNSRMTLTPQSGTQVVSEKPSFTNFTTWKKQANFQSLFNFYLPDSVQIKTIEANKKFQIESSGKTAQSLVSIEQLTYPEFQKAKLSMDTRGEKQYGWTNAYGASVFEYKKDMLTAFVVDKEKKEVLKVFTPEENNFALAENIVRTFQTTAKETDLHGPWYVNFIGGYKLRYTSDEVLQTENPFEHEIIWNVKFKDPKKSGTIKMVTSDQPVDGGISNPLQKVKVDGVEAMMYQYDDLSIGVMWQKNNQYFWLKATGDSAQTTQTLKNLMLQMITSFRFLTDQEQVK